MQQRMNNIRILAALIVVAGLMLVIYSLLSYQSTAGGYSGHDGMMGVGGSVSTQYYTVTNMFLAIVGALLLGSGIIYAIPRQLHEVPFHPAADLAPVPWFAGARRPTEEGHQQPEVPSGTAMMDTTNSGPSIHDAKGGLEAPRGTSDHLTSDAENGLVLRLLSGDERTIFRTIRDAGGEVLQRDIVATTKMSEAKVSRVIDKLVEKGLVVKERNGMGNKVRIEIED